MRVLILGGTTEASRLARLVAGRSDLAPVLSLAGRTEAPARQPIPTRSGGFGGVAGLVAYLRAEAIEAVVDATHPFAAVMSRHAAEACRIADVPLCAHSRPPWQRVPGDRWTEVADNAAAAAALGTEARRVLLTIGRLGVADFRAAPQHHYVIRSIDPPPAEDLPPDSRLILDRGPFDEAGETALMRGERIDVLVTKNSGGAATYPKIAAARRLGLPVLLVTPPARPDMPLLTDPDAVLAFLDRHRRAAPRG
ncbi:cobalt-precorrin-6A reductase [Prosthecodimorpha staleyi]|uniref:Cobalt-precorrin-6A reductase n=1 Tax=Prosthecodimorpha staleyi TaxID=2840188 RepID=A0A947D8L6_9HYPH|nr:cobalt-precorrin-6A reductase [Prosthecodimorpha staleyi]MBT9292089.1 cobalt-precorrin-6A reductase [Prosthecodimorpha staleyi]